jgi:AcrR family transcriptional regulator
MTRRRLEPADRKREILAAAIRIARKPGGWHKLTREAVAAEAGCADALISRHFGTIPNFKRDVMRAAIAQQVLPIIAQGLAAGDRHASKASPELKNKALNSLA